MSHMEEKFEELRKLVDTICEEILNERSEFPAYDASVAMLAIIAESRIKASKTRAITVFRLYKLYRLLGSTMKKLGGDLGLTSGRIQQLVKRGKEEMGKKCSQQ